MSKAAKARWARRRAEGWTGWTDEEKALQSIAAKAKWKRIASAVKALKLLGL